MPSHSEGARDLAFCLKVPLDSLLVWASSGGSGETARMRRLAWTFAARIGDKYQIRLARPVYNFLLKELFHRPYRMKRRESIYFTRLHVSKTRAWNVLSYCYPNWFWFIDCVLLSKKREKCLHTSHYSPTPLDHSKETSFLENPSLSK